jgi:adenosylcobinamide-GDP ribazoletransferase
MFEDDRPGAAESENRSSAEWAEDLQAASAFLTRLPVRWAAAGTFDMRRAARAFPVAGALIGLAAALVLILCGAIGMSALLSATFTIAALLIITGALHEDGLADTADGFWGAAEKERKLEIMRDGRIGTFGVSALLFSVIIRIAAIAQIIESSLGYGVAALVAAETISRHGMVALMIGSTTARSDGLAVSAGTPLPAANRASLAIALAIGIPALWFAGGIRGVVIAGIVAILAFMGVRELASKHIGGYTGDVCGAMQQVIAIGILTGLAVAVGS